MQLDWPCWGDQLDFWEMPKQPNLSIEFLALRHRNKHGNFQGTFGQRVCANTQRSMCLQKNV